MLLKGPVNPDGASSCLVYFQGCVVLRPQQNYVYVLSRYLNSLVRIVVLVLCLTTVLLVVGTTTCFFAFLLYLIRTSSIIWAVDL